MNNPVDRWRYNSCSMIIETVIQDGARYAFSASAKQSAVFVIDIRSRELVETRKHIRESKG